MLTRPYALARPACPGVYLRAAQGSSSTLVVNTGSAGSGTGAVAATSTAVTGPTTAAGPPYGVGAAAGTTVATDRRLRSGQLEFVVRTPFPSRAPAPAAAILDAVAASQNDLFPELRTVRAWTPRCAHTPTSQLTWPCASCPKRTGRFAQLLKVAPAPRTPRGELPRTANDRADVDTRYDPVERHGLQLKSVGTGVRRCVRHVCTLTARRVRYGG